MSRFSNLIKQMEETDARQAKLDAEVFGLAAEQYVALGGEWSDKEIEVTTPAPRKRPSFRALVNELEAIDEKEDAITNRVAGLAQKLIDMRKQQGQLSGSNTKALPQ